MQVKSAVRPSMAGYGLFKIKLHYVFKQVGLRLEISKRISHTLKRRKETKHLHIYFATLILLL